MEGDIQQLNKMHLTVTFLGLQLLMQIGTVLHEAASYELYVVKLPTSLSVPHITNHRDSGLDPRSNQTSLRSVKDGSRHHDPEDHNSPAIVDPVESS